ncbi:hypothetical protein ABVT39_019518 [Epinephelus coioides]
MLSSHRPFAETGESAPHGSLCSQPLASCTGGFDTTREMLLFRKKATGFKSILESLRRLWF